MNATHILSRGKKTHRIVLLDADLAINHPDIKVPKACRDHYWISFHVEGATTGLPMLWTCAPDELKPIA
jgi:hypothetical protein